jgi:ABC-2 type transport system ATP-binding protein
MEPPSSSNDDQTRYQAQYWNGPEASHWLVHEHRDERMLAAFTHLVLGAAATARTDRVLDVGCGTGATTSTAARDTADGQALGVDISRPLLLWAEQRARHGLWHSARPTTYRLHRPAPRSDESWPGAEALPEHTMTTTQTTPISVHGLTKQFGRIRAVEELTFEVRPGQITGFLGPNGAGKTTTLRMLLGLVRPTAGAALIGGRPYPSLPHPRRTVGAVLEATGAHPGRRARDHLQILAQVTGVPEGRVAEVCDQVGLAEATDRRVGGYSLGMRQRLGLAGALLGDPPVLLLDEPANGLDPAGVAWLRGLLRDLADQGRTILLSRHLLSEAAQTVDQVVIINQGRLRFAGPLDDLGDLEASFLRLTDTHQPSLKDLP